jgi:hypothetical protein
MDTGQHPTSALAQRLAAKSARTMPQMTILNIGNEAFNSTEVAEKVQNDISFLLARIEHLQQQSNPNPVVLQTYREMLESRQAVLEWLVHDQSSIPFAVPKAS